MMHIHPATEGFLEFHSPRPPKMVGGWGLRGGAWWGAEGAYALKAGEATTTAKKNLSVDGMAKIMVIRPYVPD